MNLEKYFIISCVYIGLIMFGSMFFGSMYLANKIHKHLSGMEQSKPLIVGSLGPVSGSDIVRQLEQN